MAHKRSHERDRTLPDSLCATAKTSPSTRPRKKRPLDDTIARKPRRLGSNRRRLTRSPLLQGKRHGKPANQNTRRHGFPTRRLQSQTNQQWPDQRRTPQCARTRKGCPWGNHSVLPQMRCRTSDQCGRSTELVSGRNSPTSPRQPRTRANRREQAPKDRQTTAKPNRTAWDASGRCAERKEGGDAPGRRSGRLHHPSHNPQHPALQPPATHTRHTRTHPKHHYPHTSPRATTMDNSCGVQISTNFGAPRAAPPCPPPSHSQPSKSPAPNMRSASPTPHHTDTTQRAGVRNDARPRQAEDANLHYRDRPPITHTSPALSHPRSTARSSRQPAPACRAAQGGADA